MEMSQLYDEDLLENHFFQQFCDMCSSLFEAAVENEWLICVPKVGTFEGHTLTEVDCMSHVLIEVEARQYKTASDKHVSISDKVITLGEGFDSNAKIQMLFSETFYTDKRKKYLVWCIERPLSFTSDLPPSLPHSADFHIANVDDAMEFLFTGDRCALKKSIDKMIATHKSAMRLGRPTLRDLIDTIHSLFTKCVQVSHKDTQLRKRLVNKHVANSLHLAIETYINHKLYTDLFGYICTAVATEDAQVNKISRNLSQSHRNDFGVNSDFSCNFPRARRELLTFTTLTTPLAKMASIKRVILALMQSPKNTQEIEPLTADDLIPMLVFLIVRSSNPNWTAHFEYMTQFHFSHSALDEYSFYLSTMEAAIFYIKSGELMKLLSADKPADGDSLESGGKSSELSPKIATSTPQIAVLFEAIRHGDLEGVQSMLEQSEDKERRPRATSTRCHPLCSCDKCEHRKDEEGANPRSAVTVFSRNDKGFTALHQAALYGRAEVVEYLYSCGGLVNATDYHGSTPLHIASQRGHQGAALMLIDSGADINAKDNDGNRPLHMATLNGHEDCIKALLYQCGAGVLDVNAINDSGDTPLHQAAKWSYESITQLLLDHGAWPEARNRRNATPMMLVSDGAIASLLTQAIEKVQEQANDGFIEVTEPQSPPQALPILSDTSQQSSFTPTVQPQATVSKSVVNFLKSVSDGDIRMMKQLMGWTEAEYVSSSDSDDGVDGTQLCHPLCQCKRCSTSHKQLNLLDINAGDEQGRTALHIAAEKANLEVMTMLLEKHADVNCKTNLVQFTPLHLVSQHLTPNVQMVALLLQHGAKVNCKDCNGRTPLHFSSQTGSTSITVLLLQNKANVNCTNTRGNTPLHEASKVNNIDIVQLLLRHGANPSLVNKNGVTAMQIASDPKIVRLISEAIDNLNSQQELSSLCDLPHPRVAIQQAEERRESCEATLRRDMFAALESDNIDKLNQLTSSISSFNKQSLRRTITRDRSAPVLSVASNSITELPPAASSPLISAAPIQTCYESDEQPECDLHLSQGTVSFRRDSHCEYSGTESAGE